MSLERAARVRVCNYYPFATYCFVNINSIDIFPPLTVILKFYRLSNCTMFSNIWSAMKEQVSILHTGLLWCVAHVCAAEYFFHDSCG